MLNDGLAEGREVILFNSRGIASSGRTSRNSIEDMTDDMALVIQALGLSQADLLGFSLGGFEVQEVALRHPQLVRKLLLLGTGLRGGTPRMGPKVLEVAPRPVPTVETSSTYSSAVRRPPSGQELLSGSDVISAPTKIRRVRQRTPRPKPKPMGLTCSRCSGMRSRSSRSNAEGQCIAGDSRLSRVASDA